MSVIHSPRKPELDIRMLLFPGAMFAMLSTIFVRLWYFQVVKAPELQERADATREDKIVKPAPRGLIYDRHGELLAGLKPQIVITAKYDVVKKNPEVIDKLAKALSVDPKKILAKVSEARQAPSMFMPIYLGASETVGTRIAEAGNAFPGIGVDLAPMRFYPDGVSFAHILGYVRLPNAKDIKRIQDRGREPAQFVGKGGIEQYYETDLMGSVGDEVMEVDVKRHPLRILARDNPVPGNRLVLTIDAGLQRYAEACLMQVYKDKGFVGSAVALDPKTGEVLCMVSSPTYDASKFQVGISRDDWHRLESDPDHPLIKRPIQSCYSPGSTFKIITSLAAYETGKFDPNRTYFCAGGYHLGRKVFACLGHHGNISYKEALIRSCNTYFADLGFRAGADALRKASEEMGLGQPTGLDEGGEWTGVVPTEQWMQKHFKRPHWFGGDTVNFSIGQGYVSATPLQMADVASMVANSGAMYRPHLVKEIDDPNDPKSRKEIQPQIFHSVQAGQDFWGPLKDALEGVIESGHGTGAGARIPGVLWAGKTGSTENGRDKKANKTHSWFVGYAPADNPKIAICVLIENAGHGGDIAAPIARDIVKHYLLPPASAAAVAKRASSFFISSAVAPSPSVR